LFIHRIETVSQDATMIWHWI